MKIAILVPNFSEYSGDARVAELQSNDYVKKGHIVTIFALSADIRPKNASLVIMGMPKSLFWERIYRLMYPLDFIQTLKWFPKLKDFDIVISHLYPMNFLCYMARKFFPIKYVYWYHGIPGPEFYDKIYEKLYLHLFILMTKLTIKNADQMVSVSKFAQGELIKYTGFASEVIYNQADFKRFCKGIDGSEIRKKHRLGDDPVILNVGRVCPQKGAHLLIDSFSFVKMKLPNAKLVIVGKHTYDSYSKELMKKCDKSVIFTGYVSDEELPLYYGMCDIYATCSLWETFNIPVAEAQACGKPVIAFDIGPHSEVVEENGILVEKGNIKKFAEACSNKISSEQHRRSQETYEID